MNDGSSFWLDERVLVLAPTPADAALSQSLLAEAGLACHVCADLSGLCLAYAEGAGAILLTEEVLGASDSECLVAMLHEQAAWSDVPILLLTSQGADSRLAVEAMERLGNVTLLERPVRLNTLVSALRTALRARRRQYELRSRLQESRANEEELRKRQEILRLVHQIGKVGHWEWNSRSDENKWSPELEALYGLKPGTFGGTYDAWAKLLHPDDLPKAEEDVRRALETGKYFTEFRVIWPDGSVHWIEARANVFKDGHDKPIRIMGVNMDITERKRQEEALREADRRKDEFLATLAHELRNPLAPLRNALEVLCRCDGDAAVTDQARSMMGRQLDQMVRLIDDLLDISRISRSHVRLRKERVELQAVVGSALEAVQPLMQTQAHELTVTVPTEPIYLDADPTRLAQVTSNLLTNAAKYTEKGGHVWLTVERQGKEAVVSVRDTGIGIAAEHLPHLFEMFSQLTPALERSQGGLGIGLALVRGLVELHGGRVEARSDGIGRGSQFIIRLPVVDVAPGEEAKPAAEDSTVGDARKRRILTVDDNRDAADSLAIVLRMMGHEVRTAYDGLEAVQAAAAFRPEVVLLDIGLPKMNGYEAARHMRQQGGGRQMALIALTGWGQEEDKRRALEAGFDHHLTKPVQAAALKKLLALLQSRSQH